MACLILLIEDNDDIRENTVELLELEGYDVLAAGDGSRALELIAEQIPDLIVCDVVMPGLNGYDVFDTLQNNPNTRSIPFIFTTAQSERADLAKAKSLGVRHYLVKPFDDKELLACINNCL
ncbi:response regulator [Mucilaginibacter boryungensis]|uniref:Response regulator n=1 Tax=Mucilaginibacter boryungensis TaxID=768480 RepID=A0ABR9XFC3_9SPHI|nr:response regulator [Mucilaginibacter boryungensis]MBE9665704.1 response regulator [Mucilaginibacter boryungensis]